MVPDDFIATDSRVVRRRRRRGGGGGGLKINHSKTMSKETENGKKEKIHASKNYYTTFSHSCKNLLKNTCFEELLHYSFRHSCKNLLLDERSNIWWIKKKTKMKGTKNEPP